MPTRRLLYPSVLLFTAVLAAETSSISLSDEPPAERSFAQGTPVSHPESLSGLWEAPDGKGGAVGIYLQLSTTVPGAAATLVGASQSWEHLDVALYQRQGPTLDISKQESNSFSDSSRGGGVHFEHDRLTLHFEEFDLDLLHVPGDQWIGRFHRGAFDRNVTLQRPNPENTTAPSIVGTWREAGSPIHSCIHIFQTAPGDGLAALRRPRSGGAKGAADLLDRVICIQRALLFPSIHRYAGWARQHDSRVARKRQSIATQDRFRKDAG